MVKKIFYFLFYALFFFGALLFFLPKEEFYYLVEKELQQYGIIIDDEEIQERSLSLEVTFAKVYVKEIEVARVQRADIKLLGIYNALDCENILLSGLATNFLPARIDSLHVGYTLVDPLHIDIDAKGAFGVMHATLSLYNRTLVALVQPSKRMLQKYRATLRVFTKDADGGYRYEYSLK